jgi:hypothetical protein
MSQYWRVEEKPLGFGCAVFGAGFEGSFAGVDADFFDGFLGS